MAEFRRFQTDLVADSYSFRIVSVPVSDDRMNEIIGVILSDELQFTQVDVDALVLGEPEEVSQAFYTLKTYWHATEVLTPALAQIGVVDDRLVDELAEVFSRGRIVLETSPPRIRRLVGVPLSAVLIAAGTNPVLVIVFYGGVVIVDAIATPIFRGFLHGVEKSSEFHGERLANRVWNRLFPHSPDDVQVPKTEQSDIAADEDDRTQGEPRSDTGR